MVASNLIVHGNLDAALQLLLVVGRADEACRHLQNAKRCGRPSLSSSVGFFPSVVICSDFGVCCVVLLCCSVLFFYTVHRTQFLSCCTPTFIGLLVRWEDAALIAKLQLSGDAQAEVLLRWAQQLSDCQDPRGLLVYLSLVRNLLWLSSW